MIRAGIILCALLWKWCRHDTVDSPGFPIQYTHSSQPDHQINLFKHYISTGSRPRHLSCQKDSKKDIIPYIHFTNKEIPNKEHHQSSNCISPERCYNDWSPTRLYTIVDGKSNHIDIEESKSSSDLFIVHQDIISTSLELAGDLWV